MRFLVDAALSPAVAEGLRQAGHDAIHLIDYQMLRASDTEVLQRALEEDRAVVSADTDFAMLLAIRSEARPSLVLFRHPLRSPKGQVAQMLAVLDAVTPALEDGSIVVITEARLRIRRLPVSGVGET